MKTTKVILGLAVAAAAGAAIGMLLAPEKGSDLQKRMKEGVRDWMDELKKLVATGREIAGTVKSDAEDGLDRIKTDLRSVEG